MTASNAEVEMAKPTTGRMVREDPPDPDEEQMVTDTLMTSVFSGIGLIVGTMFFAVFGYAGLALGDRLAGADGARFGLGLGLAVGLAVFWTVLRRFSEPIRARSRNLYRGAWIGGIGALGIIVLMAYLPQVVFPQYCPPGAVCENGQR
jgi:hypothetical protein